MFPEDRIKVTARWRPFRIPSSKEVWDSRLVQATLRLLRPQVVALRPLVGMLLLAWMLPYAAEPNSSRSDASIGMMLAFGPFVALLVRCAYTAAVRRRGWIWTAMFAGCTAAAGLWLVGDDPQYVYFKTSIAMTPYFVWTCAAVGVQTLLWEPFLRSFRAAEAGSTATQSTPFRRALFWIAGVYLALFQMLFMAIAGLVPRSFGGPATFFQPGAFGRLDVATEFYILSAATGILVWALSESAGFAFAPHLAWRRRLTGGAALAAVYTASIQFVHQWNVFSMFFGVTAAWFGTGLLLLPCVGSAILCGVMVHRFPPTAEAVSRNNLSARSTPAAPL